MIRWLFLQTILCTVGFGQFTFEAAEQVPKATPHQKEFNATFRFKNTGKQTITITTIKSTCSCLPADLKKKIYKPGEEGEIKASLKFASNRGRYVRKISVNTLDENGKAKTYTLLIGSIIPDFAKFDTRFHNWKPGDKPEAKRYLMTVIHEDPINILKIESSNPNWTVTHKVVKDGREYEIWLKPPNTDEASRTALSIEVNYPAKRHLVFRTVGRVTQPPPPENESKGWLEKMLKEDGI